MKAVIQKAAGLLLFTSMMTACSVDNATVADIGIGGSGYVATGTITGFGSVFVNGIEFETTATSFDVDDEMASQAALRIGMVVRVNGSVNADGITGTATRILYDNELEGPISAIVLNANLTKTLTILGTDVVVDSGDTVFEGTTFNALSVDNVVEISGYHTANDEIQATLVDFKSASWDSDTIVEIKGVISQLSGTNFKVSKVNVNALAANLTDLPAGLANGAYVEVKGTYQSGTNTINAIEVEAEEIELGDDGDSASIEGYITRYVSISDFDIDGHRVDASSAELEPSGITLSIGEKVEAEGTLNNGILVATEVEVRAGSAEISAYVETVDLVNKIFTLRVVAFQPVITVKMNTATRTEDDTASNNDALTDLASGDFVEVAAFESAATTVTASRVSRKAQPAEKIVLQGVMTGQLIDSITILGVNFPVDVSTTSYDSAYSSAVINQSVIRIEDVIGVGGVNAEGTADRVELEEQ
ncbi:MAG: DUF5666 domain-containing protein [Gammaproteobacteria bacterium]|nr:DUF5666 domain-containing protein [Gammaproteobacteria bacterium]